MKLIEYAAYLKSVVERTSGEPSFKHIGAVIQTIHDKETNVLYGYEINPIMKKLEQITLMPVGETNSDRELIELIYDKYIKDSEKFVDEITKQVIVEKLAHVIDIVVYKLDVWEDKQK